MTETLPPPELSPVIAGCWRMADWGWTPGERMQFISKCGIKLVHPSRPRPIVGRRRIKALDEALAAQVA